jgi:hypothetical protein
MGPSLREALSLLRVLGDHPSVSVPQGFGGKAEPDVDDCDRLFGL